MRRIVRFKAYGTTEPALIEVEQVHGLYGLAGHGTAIIIGATCVMVEESPREVAHMLGGEWATEVEPTLRELAANRIEAEAGSGGAGQHSGSGPGA